MPSDLLRRNAAKAKRPRCRICGDELVRPANGILWCHTCDQADPTGGTIADAIRKANEADG